MTINRVRALGSRDLFSVECDECGDCHDLDAETLLGAVQEIRSIPWAIRKDDNGTWRHLCPCSSPSPPEDRDEDEALRRYRGDTA